MSIILIAVTACSATVFIDTSFGTNGVSLINKGSGAYVTKIITQNDNKVVVLGMCTLAGAPTIFIARFTDTGVLDTTFNTTGIVTLNFGSDVFARSMVLQADGKILIAGYTIIGNTAKALVARYTALGQLDETFGSGGVVTPLIGANSTAFCLGLQTIEAIQYILVTGQATVDGDSRAFITRYDSNGNLDSTFAIDGVALIQISSVPTPMAMTVLDDNKILIAGSVINGNRKVLLARYTSSGMPDPDFGVQGIVKTGVTDSVDDVAQAIIEQPDGKIVVVGRSQFNDHSRILVMRYMVSGDLDPDFGIGGITTTAVHDSASGYSVNLKADNTFIVSAGCTNDCMLVHYLANGSLDQNFGVNGVLTTTVNCMPSCYCSLDDSERMLVGASIGENGAIARYRADTSDFIAIESPADQSEITSADFSITGRTSRASALIRIKVDGTVMRTVTSDAVGNWQGNGFNTLNGHHSITAELMDGETVIATTTNAVMVTIATDNVSIGSFDEGAILSTNTPSLSGGSSRAGNTIYIKIDDMLLEPLTTDLLGHWNAGMMPYLANGPHTVNVALVNGSTLIASMTRTFTVSSLQGAPGEAVIPGQTYFFVDEDSDLSGYEVFSKKPAHETESHADSTLVNASSSEALIDQYATGFGDPWTSVIPAGTWTFNIWGSVDDPNIGRSTLVIRIFKRAANGAEIELFYVETDKLSANTAQLYSLKYVQKDDIELEDSDRLLVKLYAKTDSISDRMVSYYYEGHTTYSHVITPLSIVGPQGIRGETGLTGLTGQSGRTGITGSSGITGVTGLTGLSGMTGQTAVTGVSGLSGLTGNSGVTGFSGNTGVTGFTGLSGVTGITGLSGLTGLSGITGITGATGLTGMSLHYLYAYMTNTVANSASFVQIQFNNTPQRDGWGYDSGTFTCPATGLYLVEYFGVLNRNSLSIDSVGELVLYSNGAEIVGTQIHSGSDADVNDKVIGRSAIVALNANDTLQVRFAATGNGQLVANSPAGASGVAASVIITRLK